MYTVLHIILRILLVILIVVLCIIILLLVVPVRYRADLKDGSGEKEEKFSLGTVKKGLDLKLDFWWLLKLINGRLALNEEGGSFRLRFMVFTIPINTKRVLDESKEIVDKQKERQKKDLKQRAGEMVNRLIDMYNQTGTDFLQRVLGKGFRKVSGVLRGILPTSLTCNGIIGTGDPAGTGKVFMIVSFVRMLLRENNKKTDISLEPDMDHACLQVEAGIKGRLFLFNILVLVMWFLTDRDMVRMRKAMKKGKSNKGKSKKEESEQEKSEQGGSGEGKELNDERE